MRKLLADLHFARVVGRCVDVTTFGGTELLARVEQIDPGGRWVDLSSPGSVDVTHLDVATVRAVRVTAVLATSAARGDDPHQ